MCLRLRRGHSLIILAGLVNRQRTTVQQRVEKPNVSVICFADHLYLKFCDNFLKTVFFYFLRIDILHGILTPAIFVSLYLPIDCWGLYG